MGKRLSVLIAGCGDVGSRLGLQLGRDGWRVYGLRRNAAELPVPILPVKGDLTDPTCPRCWPNGGLDYLVYAASATEHDEAGYRQPISRGCATCFAGCDSMNSSRAVCCSFPAPASMPSATANGSTRFAHRADRLHRAGNARGRATGPRLRPAGHLRAHGRPVRPESPLAAEPVRAGLRVERDPPQYSNRIHRDDAAALLAFLLQADASGTALQPCYLGSTTSRRRCTRWSTGCASGWVSPTGPSRA